MGFVRKQLRVGQWAIENNIPEGAVCRKRPEEEGMRHSWEILSLPPREYSQGEQAAAGDLDLKASALEMMALAALLDGDEEDAKRYLTMCSVKSLKKLRTQAQRLSSLAQVSLWDRG